MGIENILKTIDDAISVLHFNTENYTFIHKLCVYEAFKTITLRHPDKMEQYLLVSRKNVGLQNLIFQEYISSLEKKLPFSSTKNRKKHTIHSLLDDDLCLFDGVSEFDGIVDERGLIKNNTREFYIGGRCGTYSKPYWIGKLLDVLMDGKSILHNVKKYSFTQIEMENAITHIPVHVIHLRVPPHYQMGGMVLIAKIKKKLTLELHK